MLTKTCFDRCMNTLLTFADVLAEPEKNKAFYNLMKNDFEDKEFCEICEDICKTEILYGHYPAPKLFYDRQTVSPLKQILVGTTTFYLDDTIPKYREVLSDLDQKTRDEVCQRVFEWIMENKFGQYITEDFIVQRLLQFRPQTRMDDYPTLSEIKKLIDDHQKEKEPI